MALIERQDSQTLPAPPPEPQRRVLVVDDSRLQRRILVELLSRWGFAVHEAASGQEAMDLAARLPVDIVLSDWMMPCMDGLEFCRAFRALPRDRYGYFILLTSKTDKADVAAGLEVGADDFLGKPVHPAELRARLRAGERVLGMERELTEKNRLLHATVAKLRDLYDALERDLREARRLQVTLVRERHRDFGTGDVSLLLRPSGHIGGDLVGFFPVGPGRVALYGVDVAGHGVASALMAARIAGALSGDSPDRNIALRSDGRGAWPPEIVADRLNRMLLDEMRVDQYLTLVYAEADLATGEVQLVQAGHPHPLIARRDGTVQPVGRGGLPVGLLRGATYDRISLRLNPGERLFLMSDGITECRGADGTELGEEGLAAILLRHRGLRGPAFLESMVRALERHAGGQEFRDDISAVVFDFHGPPGQAT